MTALIVAVVAAVWVVIGGAVALFVGAVIRVAEAQDAVDLQPEPPKRLDTYL